MGKWRELDSWLDVPCAQRLLVYDGTGEQIYTAIHPYGTECFYPAIGDRPDRAMGAFTTITHWMPLPEPPERMERVETVANRLSNLETVVKALQHIGNSETRRLRELEDKMDALIKALGCE